MNKKLIESFVRARILRYKQSDINQIKSMIEFADINSKVALSISLNENSATLIFREIYESIRQLGDASWRLLNYVPLNHEISLEGLKNLNINEKLKLDLLPRFKKLRNDVNYRGFRIGVSQAREIIDFWDSCGKEAIEIMNNQIYKLLNKINEQE